MHKKKYVAKLRKKQLRQSRMHFFYALIAGGCFGIGNIAITSVAEKVGAFNTVFYFPLGSILVAVIYYICLGFA